MACRRSVTVSPPGDPVPWTFSAPLPYKTSGMRLRALRDACLGGFLYGALLYGAVLSLVHVLHNHLGSARDALIAFGFVLLYGLWGAAFFGLAAWRPSPSRGRRPKERRGLLLGLFVFNLFFWEVFFLYGLTYDQAPLHPTGAWGHGGGARAARGPDRPRARRSAPGCCSGSSRRSGAAALGVGGPWPLRGRLRGPRRGAALRGAGAGREAGRRSAPAIPVDGHGLKVIFVGFDGADWRVTGR